MPSQVRSTKMCVGIVGGSLVGLSAAIALARIGIRSIVFERETRFDSATGLGVDPSMLLEITGVDPRDDCGKAWALPMVLTHRYTTSWILLNTWLRFVASNFTNIQVLSGIEAVEIHASRLEATVTTSTKQQWHFDCVLGADGYRSRVRRCIDHDHPEPVYGGAVIWRGLAPEKTDIGLISESGGAIGDAPDSLRLIAYPVPGLNGVTKPGQRKINWGWYDSSRLALLEQLGCVHNGNVMRSAQHAEVSFLRDDLERIALERWPTPWREYIRDSLRQFAWFGTPVAEYAPARLVDGRLGLIGDAAHVAAPVTGAGLSTGLADVLALASEFKDLSSTSEIPAALGRYEKRRLSDGQKLVLDGRTQMARILRMV